MKSKKIAYLPLVVLMIISFLPAITSVSAIPSAPTSGSTQMYVIDLKFNTPANLTCNTYDVTVGVFNVTNMQGFEFKLWYNQTLLTPGLPTLNPAVVDPAAVLGPVGPAPGYYWSPHNCSTCVANGYVWVVVANPLGKAKTIPGSQWLVHIPFHINMAPPRGTVLPPGYDLCVSCPLTLNETTLGDPSGLPIPHTALSGVYEYCRPQIVAGAPVCSFTWAPMVPYVGNTVTVTDTSTPDGGTLISWDWSLTGSATWITANNMSTRQFTCDGAGTVTVTLNVSDDQGMSSTCSNDIQQFLAVGCILDLYTSTNRFCGQTTTRIGEGIAVVDGEIIPLSAYVDALTNDVNITLYAKVSWNGAPRMHVLVTFEIIYEWKLYDQDLWMEQGFPNGFTLLNETVAYRTAETNKDGIATTWFRVPTPCPGAMDGKWLIIATGKVQERKQADWIRFDVGKLVQIENVFTIDGDLFPDIVPRTTFCAPCSTIGIVVELKNIALMYKGAIVTVVVYDDCDVPIGSCVDEIVLNPGVFCSPSQDKAYCEVHVPQWAYVGVGKIYVSVLTNYPRLCGVAYSAEAVAYIAIEWCPP